jgi:hypothetical protein
VVPIEGLVQLGPGHLVVIMKSGGVVSSPSIG